MTVGTRFALIAAVVLVLSLPASASLVHSVATGDQLAGGTLTVTFLSAGEHSVPIGTSAVVGQGYAEDPGYFTFTVTGDTYENRWRLTNDTASDIIVSALFDLNGSISVFDNNIPNPGTVGSEIGELGVSAPRVLHRPRLLSRFLGRIRKDTRRTPAIFSCGS